MQIRRSKKVCQNDARMSKIVPKSMPNPCQNAPENQCKTKPEKRQKTEPAGPHQAGPALSPGMAKINQSTNPCD